jgi:dTMP kinase
VIELSGKYIVIEGTDGTGKSTQVKMLPPRLAKSCFESIEFSEPATDPKDGVEDVPIADALRALIKNGTLERDAITNLFLFSAARREKWNRKALPALKLGKCVVASRNYYSTEAYQGYGEGLDLETIRAMTRLATDDRYMHPDIAIILSMEDEAERQTRIGSRGPLENPDTFESRGNDFQKRVNDAYLDIADRYKIPVISASGTPQEVSDRIWAVVEPALLAA